MEERFVAGARVFLSPGNFFPYLRGHRATVQWQAYHDNKMVLVKLDKEPKNIPRLLRREGNLYYLRPEELRRISREGGTK